MFYLSFLRTRHQCLGLYQEKAGNVCSETWADQRSRENDERCEFTLMLGRGCDAPDRVDLEHRTSNNTVVSWVAPN